MNLAEEILKTAKKDLKATKILYEKISCILTETISMSTTLRIQ